jgi:hypothetical protein
MATIKSFTSGPTSSGMMTWYAAILDCGHWHYSPESWSPFPASMPVGTEVECSKCAEHKKAEEFLNNVDMTGIAYLRFSPRWAYPEQGILGQYHAYRREPTSPTGVLHAWSVPATKAIDAIIDRRRLCTMSPTEGRNAR